MNAIQKAGNPVLSVIMPVYNAEKYVAESIRSILSQSFGDFEFIIINDCSNDRSGEVIRSFADPRIIYLENPVNSGIVRTLNRGLEAARGDFIARLDADDIALPERFQVQLEHFRQHPEISLLGAHARLIDKNGKRRYSSFTPPLDHESIRAALLFDSAFVSSSFMARKEVFEVLRFSEDFPLAEDYFLWTQVVDRFRTANLGQELVLYRTHDTNITRVRKEEETRCVSRIFREQLQSLGIEPDEPMLKVHHAISDNGQVSSFHLAELRQIEAHLLRIRAANQTRQVFDPAALDGVLSYYWMRCCKKTTQEGLRLIRFFRESELTKLLHPGEKSRLDLYVHSLGNTGPLKAPYNALKKLAKSLLKA